MKVLFTAIIIAAMSLTSCTKENNLSANSNGSPSSVKHSQTNKSFNSTSNNEGSQGKTLLTVDFSLLDSIHAEVEIIVTDLTDSTAFTFVSLNTLPVIQTATIYKHHQYKVEYKNYNTEGATWGNYSMSCENILYWGDSSLTLLPYNQYSSISKEPVTFDNSPVMAFTTFGCAFF